MLWLVSSRLLSSSISYLWDPIVQWTTLMDFEKSMDQDRYIHMAHYNMAYSNSIYYAPHCCGSFYSNSLQVQCLPIA